MRIQAAGFSVDPRLMRAKAPPAAAPEFSGRGAKSAARLIPVPALALAAMMLGGQAAKAGCDDDPIHMPPNICAPQPAGPMTPEAYQKLLDRSDMQQQLFEEAVLANLTY